MFPHVRVQMNSSYAFWLWRRFYIVSSAEFAPNSVNDDVFVEKILAHAVAEAVEGPRFQTSDDLYEDIMKNSQLLPLNYIIAYLKNI